MLIPRGQENEIHHKLPNGILSRRGPPTTADRATFLEVIQRPGEIVPRLEVVEAYRRFFDLMSHASILFEQASENLGRVGRTVVFPDVSDLRFHPSLVDLRRALSRIQVVDILIETHLVRGTLRGMWVPNWMPSMEDLLAKDWALGPKEYREHPRTLKLSIICA